MYPHERSLVKTMEGKPFVLLGINSDPDKTELAKRLKEENITWRSWWDVDTSGPISTQFNVRGWPRSTRPTPRWPASSRRSRIPIRRRARRFFGP